MELSTIEINLFISFQQCSGTHFLQIIIYTREFILTGQVIMSRWKSKKSKNKEVVGHNFRWKLQCILSMNYNCSPLLCFAFFFLFNTIQHFYCISKLKLQYLILVFSSYILYLFIGWLKIVYCLLNSEKFIKLAHLPTKNRSYQDIYIVISHVIIPCK